MGRRLLVLPAIEHARAIVASLDPADVLWLAGPGARATARGRLGATLRAVIVDASPGLDADLLGLAHGLVGRGGALLVVAPGGPRTPFERRFLREPAAHAWEPEPPPPRPFALTADQERALARISAALDADGPARIALLADRGRGKSTVLGLAASRRAGRVVATAPEPAHTDELRRHAAIPHLPLAEVLCATDLSAILVDEAAGFGVPALRALLARHPRTPIVLATTVQGYEGSGRGFLLRFLAEAGGDIERLGLSEPVRWDPGDPLEAALTRHLAWDAEPAPDPGGPVRLERIDRARLAEDEPLVRQVFGLLVHAHYRTTPGDLQRLLDAPDLHLHVARTATAVVGVCLATNEGGLSAETCSELAAGRRRIRGHALADTLVCHAGHPEAGELTMVRSLRLAVHPDRRREGLGSRLVGHVHAEHPEAELFGTVFGATPALVRLRRAQGYALVRIGAARGGRSGEVSVVMARPVSARARVLVDHLRAELARDLPTQLQLLAGDGELADGALLAELTADPVDAAPLDLPGAERIVDAWLDGPRPFEAAAHAVRELITRGHLRPDALGERERRLVEGRVLGARPWRDLAAELGGLGVPATMRALKAAVRQLRTIGVSP